MGDQKSVGEIMTTEVKTVTLNSTVKEVLNLLFQGNITGCPVVSDKGDVIGLVSTLDLIVALGMGLSETKLNGLPSQLNVKKEVARLKTDATIKDALMVLVTQHVGRVVIHDETNKLVGIVSRKDLVKYYALLYK